MTGKQILYHDDKCDHGQGAHQIDGDGSAVEQLRHRCASAKAKQHAWQRKVQHEGVEPRYRIEWHERAMRSDIPAQHQREKRESDDQDIAHGGLNAASSCS